MRLLLSILVLSAPLEVRAQAWTPAKGELDLGLAYQNAYVAEHSNSDGSRYDVGRIYSQGMRMDATYGFTDKLALKVALPFLALKYRGDAPHTLPNDDGGYHGAFQDFNVELRYKIAKQPLVITPSIAVVVPSHDYVYYAHSGVGRDLRELRVGVNLGRRLNPILPNAFVQAQYSYRFVEKAANTSHDSALAEAQLGYFVTRRLALIGLATWMDTFGGYSFNSKGWETVDSPQSAIAAGLITEEQWLHHDQISHFREFNAGGGAAYQLNPRVAIFGAAVTAIKNSNVHVLAAGITVGMNWTFQTRREGVRVTRSPALGGAGNLAQQRCMCPKQ